MCKIVKSISLRRRGEPPRKLVAIALSPSFLGANRNGVRRGLRPPPMQEVDPYGITSSKRFGSDSQGVISRAQVAMAVIETYDM